MDEEILQRMTTALANEGARVLDEGYAARAGDIDVIYCYGFGFPRYRGGPMFYADTVGLRTVLARVHDYRRFGDHWQPAPLLERLAAEDRGFYTRAPGIALIPAPHPIPSPQPLAPLPPAPSPSAPSPCCSACVSQHHRLEG